MTRYDFVKLRDPNGTVRRIRYTRSTKTGRVFAYVRTGMFRSRTMGGWTLSEAVRRLVDRLVREGWEVVPRPPRRGHRTTEEERWS